MGSAMRLMAVAALSAVAAAPAARADEQVPMSVDAAWAEAQLGMTFAQARSAYPQARVTGACVDVSGPVVPGCRYLMFRSADGGRIVNLFFSKQDRLVRVRFIRNDDPGDADYALAVAEQARRYAAGKEETFRKDGCEAVMARWNAGQPVRNFEFFARDIGKRTTIAKGDLVVAIGLREDSRCPGGPKEILALPLHRSLSVEISNGADEHNRLNPG